MNTLDEYILEEFERRVSCLNSCPSIPTIRCAGNYEFGVSRVIKSLEPMQKKLGTETLFYAKRCFLSLLENLAKHMILLSDQTLFECLQFLEQCESKFSLPASIVQ